MSQLEKQLQANSHKGFTTDIHLSHGVRLKDFYVAEHVLNPLGAAAEHLAKFLYHNQHLYAGKSVIDMGSGTGIQGIVMGIRGASDIVFTDFSHYAAENTWQNVRAQGLKHISIVYQGDLFEKVEKEADIIVFNHPFLAGEPRDEIEAAMVAPPELIHRFLDEAKAYTKHFIIMPFYHIAGQENNPEVQGLKHGYEVTLLRRFTVNHGIQQGDMSFYVLR